LKNRSFESGVLNSRPKLLGFHMSSPATCSFIPNKETVVMKDRE
jgi:hypothetical protein